MIIIFGIIKFINGSDMERRFTSSSGRKDWKRFDYKLRENIENIRIKYQISVNNF